MPTKAPRNYTAECEALLDTIKQQTVKIECEQANLIANGHRLQKPMKQTEQIAQQALEVAKAAAADRS